MKLGFYVPSWPMGLHPNGITTYVASVIPELKKMGHSVDIVSRILGPGIDVRDHVHPMEHPGNSMLQKVLWRFAKSEALYQLAAQSLVNAVKVLDRSQALDLFEIDEAFGVAAALRSQIRLSVVLRLHGPWFLVGPPGADQARTRREGRAIRSVGAFSAPSQFVHDAVREFYRLPGTYSSCVIPNPIADVAPGEVWKRDSSDPDTLLFVGRLDHLKGADICLDAFVKAKQTLPNLKLVLVGPDLGIDSSSGWVSFREYIASSLPPDVAASISIIGGLPPPAVREQRLRASVMLICSRFESFSYTVAEAAIQGCPIIASRVGGIPEIIQDGVNGRLYEKHDPGHLARLIVETHRNPTLASQLGAQARVDALARYQPAPVASQLVSFYREIVAREAHNAKH